MPLPKKTDNESLTLMFMQRYELGLPLKRIAEIHGLHLSYCSRLLRGYLMSGLTVPLLRKYRPSWVAK